MCCLSSVNLEHFDKWKKDEQFIDDLITMLDNVLEHFIEAIVDTSGLGGYNANFKRFKNYVREEKEGLVRRFITQVKQAVQDFETKYEKRIRNIKVVSDLKNVDDFLSSFRKNLVNVGFNLFDPIDGLLIPKQLEEKVNLGNRSYFSTVIGLAFRKLDVFGYYKFVTAVKNINLLPNRENMIAQKKAKVFSNFAFKGVIGIVSIIYIALFGLAFWQINTLNKKLEGYDEIVQTHELRTIEKTNWTECICPYFNNSFTFSSVNIYLLLTYYIV